MVTLLSAMTVFKAAPQRGLFSFGLSQLGLSISLVGVLCFWLISVSLCVTGRCILVLIFILTTGIVYGSLVFYTLQFILNKLFCIKNANFLLLTAVNPCRIKLHGIWRVGSGKDCSEAPGVENWKASFP